MDLIDLVIGIIGQLTALYYGLVGLIKFLIIEPWQSTPGFGRGFWTGLGSAAVIGSISKFILAWRAQIRRYFSPTMMPAVNPGPRPVDIYKGCSAAFAKLITIGVILLIVLTAFAIAFGE